MLIAMGIPPIELTNFMIELHSHNETVEYEIKVTERRTNYIDKKTKQCRSYDGSGHSFSHCLKDYIGSYIESHMKCSLPGRYSSYVSSVPHLDYYCNMSSDLKTVGFSKESI